MASRSVQKWAQNAQDMWDVGRKSTGGKVPEGEYACQLQSAEMKESQNGNMMIRRAHLILDGEFEGVVIRDNIVLSTEVGMSIAAEWIERMGFEVPEDLEEIEDVIAEIVEAAPEYTAQVKHSGDFVNVACYEAEASEAGDGAEEEDEEPDVEDEEAEDEAEEEEEEDAEEEEEEEEEDGPDLQPLRDFMIAQGYEAEDVDDLDVEEMVETLKGDPDVTGAKVTDDEREMLAEFGLKLRAPAKTKTKTKTKTKGKK